MTIKKSEKDTTINVIEVTNEVLIAYLVGTSPLNMNRMSAKVMQGLLLPPKKKNRGERESTLKHDPMTEFRDSAHRFRDDGMPTYLAMPGASFKRAMMTAALDLPGTAKSQIGRLLSVPDDYVPIWGIPQVRMAVVRSADINRTPDVRTTAILPRWATKISVRYTTPILKQPGIVNLLAAAGITAGVGDGRTEKGKLSFGSFRIASADDPELLAIMAQGREQQLAAMEQPGFYDDEAEALFTWFEAEKARRGFRDVKAASELTAAV